MIGGRVIHREWKLGLLGRFAIVSLVPIVLLGLVLAHFMGAQIRQRAVTDAARSAVLVSRLGIQPLLTPTDLSEGLTRSRLDALDAAVRPGLLGGDVTRIKIWNADSQIVYADDGSLIGRTFPTSHELEEALDGKREVEISGLGRPRTRRSVRTGRRSRSMFRSLFAPTRSLPGRSRSTFRTLRSPRESRRTRGSSTCCLSGGCWFCTPRCSTFSGERESTNIRRCTTI